MKDNPSISHIIIAVKVLLLLLGCCSCYKVSYNNINSNTKSYSKSKTMNSNTMNSNTMNSNSYNDIIAKRKNIVDTFPANSFHPKGLFSTNCHYQTIVGSGTLKSILLGDKQRHFNPIAERIETPDGDFFDIEMVGDYEKAKAIVVLIHGLEGSMKGNQITTLTEAMLEKGFACCLFSFRGCNGEPQR